MKIEKIDVLTSNKKHATDIAMLVDKPEFIQEIQRLRQKWQITELYKYELLDEPVLLDMHNPLFYTGINKSKIEEKLPEFNKDIDLVLKKFNRGKNFRLVVIYSLITGSVPEGVYQSCYFDKVVINELEDMNKPERYQYVIVLSPRTEKKEVIEAYQEFKAHIKGKIDFQHSNLSMDLPQHEELIMQYHAGNIHDSADIDKFKTQKELNRTREWYWIRNMEHINDVSKKQKTYEQVLDEWQKDKCLIKTNHEDITSKKNCDFCSIEDINIIEQALSAYSKLLNQS